MFTTAHTDEPTTLTTLVLVVEDRQGSTEQVATNALSHIGIQNSQTMSLSTGVYWGLTVQGLADIGPQQ
jgi:hypothetical protein